MLNTITYEVNTKHGEGCQCASCKTISKLERQLAEAQAEIKRLRTAIGDVQNTLEQIPCGGVDVITREEIDAANAVGHCVENDAVLHISATAYLICEEALKGGDK